MMNNFDYNKKHECYSIHGAVGMTHEDKVVQNEWVSPSVEPGKQGHDSLVHPRSSELKAQLGCLQALYG